MFYACYTNLIFLVQNILDPVNVLDNSSINWWAPTAAHWRTHEAIPKGFQYSCPGNRHISGPPASPCDEKDAHL